MRYILSCFLFFTVPAFAQQRSVVVYFEFANADFTEASQKEFPAMLREIIDQNPDVITVKGYTDKVGADTSNTSLGMLRARKVAMLLKQSLPRTKIIFESFGETKLVTAKNDEQALNRRAEIIFPVKKEAVVTSLEPVKIDADEQRFTINLDDTVSVTAKEGTVIRVSPGSLEYHNKNTATGSAVMIIKEYYSAGTMILAGMHTASPQGPLQTGGMVSVMVIQGSDTLEIKKGKTAVIKMPVSDNGLGNMSVFNIPQISDTSHWTSIGAPFNFFRSAWLVPLLPGVDWFSFTSVALTNMAVGAHFTETKRVRAPLFAFLSKDPPYTRSFTVETFKKTADTVLARVQVHYRNRGRRKFGRDVLDTSLVFPFYKATYEGITSKFNLINCDRLLGLPQGPDMYVSTPGYKGMNVFAYFKGARALLPGYGNGTEFSLGKLPKDLPVQFIALGKTGDKYYFGKVIPVKDKARSVILPQEFTFVEFKKQLESL